MVMSLPLPQILLVSLVISMLRISTSDGNRIGEIGAAVLKDRRDLSEDGVVLAVATVDF